MAELPAGKSKKLQEMLNRVTKPKPLLEIDGIVGEKTKNALRVLQGMGGLKKTGEIDSDTASLIARTIKSGKVDKEQPKLFVKSSKGVIGLSERQYAAQRKKLIAQLKSGPIAQMRTTVARTEAEWIYMADLNKDQWFVSFCIETTRGVDLPPKSAISRARKAYEACAAAVSSGDLQKYYSIAPKSEAVINDASYRMKIYRQKMIDGGDDWVTVLTFTKTGSFAFLGTFAAPMAGAALGTSVVASAVIGGAAVSATESVATEIGNLSAGQKNWTVGGAIKRTLIDTGVGGVLGVIAKGGGGGKHVVEAMVSKLGLQLAKQTGFKLLSTATLRRVALFLVTEGAKNTLEGAVKDTANALKGDPKLTMDKFIGNLCNNFVSGAALSPLGKVIEAFSKKASGALDPADRKRIWDVVLKELSKQAKGKTIHIGMIDKRTQALVEKYIDDQVKSQLDNVLAEVYDKWKGPMSPQALQKKISETVTGGSKGKKIAAGAVKIAKKQTMQTN